MAKLYREFVLKEKPAPTLVQIGIQAASPPAATDLEPVGGD
jgi:hypothetical protein